MVVGDENVAKIPPLQLREDKGIHIVIGGSGVKEDRAVFGVQNEHAGVNILVGNGDPSGMRIDEGQHKNLL